MVTWKCFVWRETFQKKALDEKFNLPVQVEIFANSLLNGTSLSFAPAGTIQ